MNVRKRFVAYIMCYVMALSLIPVSGCGADADNTGTDTCEHNYKISKYILASKPVDNSSDLSIP